MNKNTISCHQLGVISAIMMLVLKLTNLPSIMYSCSEIGGVISIVLMCLFNILILLLIIWFKKKYNNLSVYDILSKLLTKVGAKLIYFILFAFFIFKILALVDDGFGFVRDVVDEEFTYLNFIICFFPVAIALAYSGIRNLSRTTEFFYPFVLIGMFIAIIFSFAPLNFFGLGSFSRLNLDCVARVVSRLSFWNGDLFAILIFMDKIDLKKGKIINIFSPVILVTIFLIISYTMYFSLYQQTSTLHVNMIFDIVEYSIGTSSGWHMDIFAILVYIICLFLQGAIYIYSGISAAQKIFNFNNKKIIISGIVLLVIIVQFLYLNDYLKYVIFAQTYLSFFASALIITIPLMMILICLKRGKNAGNL